ncbi:50S ribosomal protein L9 [Candidatus Giovannonibacteria bacterium RIFCSPHIGHO2_01_FULL_45_24]|uniref:Large ribosomal subunit protein bL9 n=1 Tax=Candidatus Giovannonibacteria bacterium RIFCSPLOWO2_01_FULL_46_32 TaxID=1798353 RepID=A0A1F5XGC9_9BACT|nr:MAG: 50S ribosomal protein L9 [Candidatus Giovannonibacteria bacterium RIFCSPHIGHO2_01_FULL_45_24]OGF86920.1 MAG: 50S ribosomal protein L9 [Candidatus Giovannonibacteria bacterium RIFCSPLOWO2_01_FULL_46_32]
MKIILLKDVVKLGQKGDIKDVSDGYARNFLILRNLAAPATEENIKKTEAEAKSKKTQREHDNKEFHALKTAIAESRLPDGQEGIAVRKKSYKNGKLYAAVSAKEILDALKALGFPMPANLNEEMVKIEEPIKTTGKHNARIVLGKEEIKLQILCESAS